MLISGSPFLKKDKPSLLPNLNLNPKNNEVQQITYMFVKSKNYTINSLIKML